MRPVEYRIFARGVRYSAIPIMSISEIHDFFWLRGQIQVLRADLSFTSSTAIQYYQPLICSDNGQC